MHKELELWQFIATRLGRGESVMLLVVAESSGSSPGRQGYKMAVGGDGELSGSIGGGVMEVGLVEESRRLLSEPSASAGGFREQVHRKNAPNSSGMICSGKQTVIYSRLTNSDIDTVNRIQHSLQDREPIAITIDESGLRLAGSSTRSPDALETDFAATETTFRYTEPLGFKNDLYIIGGGHCALALSELMSRMDFYISLFDDRPELNTIEKNRFAHTIRIVDGYDKIGAHVAAGDRSYVVVMTLGYVTDGQVVRSLIDKDLKYFGVLGSSAKMATMLRELIKEGLPAEKLDRIRTPVGIPIHSRTPEEIAVSIAAEIISVKNA